MLKSINELKPVEPGVDPRERFKFDVYNSIIFVMAACILQFVKIKSVVTLTIELELTKRQNQTTLQFFECSPQAILLVAKQKDRSYQVEFQNAKARAIFGLQAD